MSTFKYSPFDLERPGIRLLRLLKGEDPLIECELFQAWHDGDETDSIPYEALSYTWGGTDMSASVQIGAQVHNVTENLYLALQQLRCRDEDRILWVDAICIDQSNLKERGHQVNQMRNIYSKADRVLIWLGPATDDTDTLFDSLKQLEKQSRRDWNLKDKRWMETWSSLQLQMQNKHWELRRRQNCRRAGLKSLLERPWFRRVWILQEVANAKKATVCSGTKSVSARVFAIAPRLLRLRPEPHCQAVLDIMPGWSRENSWWSSKRDLRALLFKFRASEAGDPRDKIYALLGMCSDCAEGTGLRADYTNDLPGVVHDTAAFLFNPSVHFYAMADLTNYIITENIQNLDSIVKTQSVEWVGEIIQSHIRDSIQSQTRNIITSSVIEAAAGNTCCGQDMMSFMLKQVGGRGNIAEITRGVIQTAEMNVECGREILEVLWRERGDEVMNLVARYDHQKAVNCLLEQHEAKIKITGDVVVAAARSPVHGWMVLCVFLEQSVKRVEIKDRAFDVAKCVIRILARSLDTRIQRWSRYETMMLDDDLQCSFDNDWERDSEPFQQIGAAARWRSSFKEHSEARPNEMDEATRLDKIAERKSNSRPLDPMRRVVVEKEDVRDLASFVAQVNTEELEGVYYGWKRVLDFFQSHHIQI
jgi:hypothetical protein